MLKRSFDIFFSLTAIIIFFIPSVIISAIIVVVGRHKIIFAQYRVGKNKSRFKIFKFQTRVDNEVTPFGRFLRKTGLDETPQFINVLRNDMSIVGPRALTEHDITRLQWNDDYYAGRWSIKPGITGYAQIFGGQNKRTSWFWDRQYIDFNNLIYDFRLILISFAMNVFGKRRIRNLIWPGKKLK